MAANPNDELLATIVRLVSQPEPEIKKAYYEALMKSTLIIAEDPEFSPRPILLNGPGGKPMLAAFTDFARLKRVCPDAKRLDTLPVQSLCRMVRHNGITMININPVQGPGVYLMPHEVEALADDKIPDVTVVEKPSWDKPDFIPANDPSLPAPEILEKLAASASELMQHVPAVESGYIMLIKAPDGSPTPTVAIRFDDAASYEDRTGLTTRIISAGEAVMGSKIRVNWLQGEQLEAVRSRGKPFYTRKS